MENPENSSFFLKHKVYQEPQAEEKTFRHANLLFKEQTVDALLEYNVSKIQHSANKWSYSIHKVLYRVRVLNVFFSRYLI